MTNTLTDTERDELEALRAAKDGTVIDEEGAVLNPASTEVATVAEWPHRTVEFAGRTWEVRKPTEQALAGFALASGKFIPQEMQNSVVGLFIKNHMSESSYTELFARLMDPDDTEFDVSTIGTLMEKIATLPDEAPAAEPEAAPAS